MSDLPNRCARVQARLPQLVDDELGRVGGRLVARHLDRCAVCTAELEHQRLVAADLAALEAAHDAQVAAHDPPPELLARLLAQVEEPGVRQRIAAPARGAVSGARPGLTTALVVSLLALVGGAVWLGWRLGRTHRRGRR